jgi:hypothetical protein
MDLTIKNYQTVLSKELLKHAEKTKVRECDEIEKGRYVAYVDEGAESFDVSLVISSKKEVVEHSCECKNSNPFCRHKAALLLYVAGAKKAKAEVKAKKKVSKSEALLEDIDPNDLKLWVKEVLKKNKDIELAFVHFFSERQQQLTPESAITITYDAIKAVAGNKKNVDPTLLKKLVDLWTEVHTPIVNYYHANVADENAFHCFHTVLETCLLYNSNINTSSNRITKYVESLLQHSVESINQIITDEAWERAVAHFIRFVHNGKYKMRLHYLHHLESIISISAEGRKQKMIESLTRLYKEHYSESIYEAYDYTRIIFNIVVNNGLFGQYPKLFRPIRFDNGFNQQLIRLLIEHNELTLAEKYCLEQIEGNFREEYNILYLLFLKEIYKLRKDEEKLASVLNRLFPYYYNFDDYLFIINRLPEEERKNWRTKMLSKARNASHSYNKEAMKFTFQLMDHEKQYRKMIDYIDNRTPYTIILEYFEPMALTDKNLLLKAIIDKKSDYGFGLYYEDAEMDAACFPELFDLMLKHYTLEHLNIFIKQTEKKLVVFAVEFFSYLCEGEIGCI